MPRARADATGVLGAEDAVMAHDSGMIGSASVAGTSVVPSVELAEVARLVDGDEDRARVLQRIVEHARSLVPGCTGAGLTVTGAKGGLDVAVTDEQVTRCHAAQFGVEGNGPAAEVLRYGEPRRVADTASEARWPAFREAARACGFRSCLALPLRLEPAAASALNLYADAPNVFIDSTFDVALLFAAQGGVGLSNAHRYGQARRLIDDLHRTLVGRSLIERAKGLLMGEGGLDSEAAFALLERRSQQEHRKLRDVAADLLRQADPRNGDRVSWNPPRAD